MKKMQAPDIEIIVRNVDRLVRNRQNMNRFREMVRQWYNAHTDKPKYELLPLSSRKHTLTEMYTLLAVIHDRYCGGMEEINPWTKVPKLSVVGTAYFDLFSYVDTQLYDNDNCTLENYLHHVKADLDAKVTIANEGQTTDTGSIVSVGVKTTVGKGSKQIKAEARLPETAGTERKSNAGKKKERPTKAEMKLREREVREATDKYHERYGHKPTAKEIADETPYTVEQVRATSTYTTDNKIKKQSGKTTRTFDTVGDSVALSEFFSEDSKLGSRTRRRSKSDEAILDKLIDESLADDAKGEEQHKRYLRNKKKIKREES